MVCLPETRWLQLALHDVGNTGRVVGHLDTGVVEGGDLLGGCAGAAGDDGAGMAHPLAGWGRPAGDEADDR